MIIGVATLGPFGRLKAPGTWGSVVGLLWWRWIVHPLTHGKALGHEVTFDLLVVLAAICFCGAAASLIGRKDPQEVILDEFACMPLVFVGLGVGARPSWAVMLAGFLLFRLLDITKPFGIRRLESLPWGIGIVADDLAAALVANGLLHVALVFLPTVFG